MSELLVVGLLGLVLDDDAALVVADLEDDVLGRAAAETELLERREAFVVDTDTMEGLLVALLYRSYGCGIV